AQPAAAKKALLGLWLSCHVFTITAAADATESTAGKEPQAEVTLLSGLGVRNVDSARNPDGIGYGPALQWGVQARAFVKPWLNFAIYYLRASHTLALPPSAAGINDTDSSIGDVLTYSLGARLEPSFPVTSNFRTWLSIGVGWGRLNLEKVLVTERERSYHVRDRSGVFVEVPIGLGASYQVLPNWLAIQIEADVAHLSKQSGNLYDPTPYVDSNGNRGFVGPMPIQSYAGSLLFGISMPL
ncbi:MAG: hypothetical protein CSA75_00500, partial [Sorangium cellulosum]